jgi:pilus assembly protein CpaD
MIGKLVSPARPPLGRAILCSLALSVLVSACASSRPPEAPGISALTPTQQYPLVSETVPDRVALAIHAEGLSPNQQTVLGDFMRRWREGGGGPIEVGAPASGADPLLARRTADAICAFLHRLGAPAPLVKIVGYDPAGAANPPVFASFARVERAIEDCSKTWDNLTSTGANRPSTHFGCSVTSNIALQVADPNDLRTPAAAEAADDGRRQVVLGKYRQGSVTSASKDSQASGQVSQ